MSIQLCLLPWTDEWLEVQKVNDIRSHKTNKWLTTIWTHLLLEIQVSFQGTLSCWLLQVSAAPCCCTSLPRKTLVSPCWKTWAASSELRIPSFLLPSALSSDRGPTEATWPESLPPPDKDEVETWTLFILRYESCWYNKAEAHAAKACCLHLSAKRWAHALCGNSSLWS